MSGSATATDTTRCEVDMQTITAVPESITRPQLCEWLATIGLVPEEVRSLRVDRGGITAEVYAKHPADGRRYAIGDDAALNTVSIPIVD